jgi:hypothetical protein
MKLIITESQYRTLVEGERVSLDYSLENIRKIVSQYQTRSELQKSEGSGFYKKARDLGILDELIPSKIETPEEADKMIENIINNVKETGEFSFNKSKNPSYEWIRKRKISDKTGKFENAINQIKKILNKFEDKKIEEIINDVSKSGRFGNDHPSYSWFYSRTRGGSDKSEKFKKAHSQIKDIISELGLKREWWGEKTIKETLVKMGFTNISRLGEYKIDDCQNSLTCKQYKFDVYLPYNKKNYMINNNIPKTGIIFEYDGIQHFNPIEFYGGEEKYINRIRSDREKNLYCKNNNIKLVRIPYTTKSAHEISHEVVYSINSKDMFITTGEYPNAGWNQK